MCGRSGLRLHTWMSSYSSSAASALAARRRFSRAGPPGRTLRQAGGCSPLIIRTMPDTCASPVKGNILHGRPRQDKGHRAEALALAGRRQAHRGFCRGTQAGFVAADTGNGVPRQHPDGGPADKAGPMPLGTFPLTFKGNLQGTSKRDNQGTSCLDGRRDARRPSGGAACLAGTRRGRFRGQNRLAQWP